MRLYHRYVEFKPFIKGMFSKSGVRGRILNKALHHQHARVYHYDRSTIYGSIDSPSCESSLRLLDMVHFDQGGRIFTYVLTLDAQFRFIETGEEFGIDLLSKHSMHSDVSNYIAFSGEFLIRRVTPSDRDIHDAGQSTQTPAGTSEAPPTNHPPDDPANYELIIDNDSGTYRPNASLLPQLKHFLEDNFPGLHIQAYACGDEELTNLKEEQKRYKKRAGDGRVFLQGHRNDTSSSISSSDGEDLQARADENKDHRTGATGTGSKLEKGLNAIAAPGETIKSWTLGDRNEAAQDTLGGGPANPSQ